MQPSATATATATKIVIEAWIHPMSALTPSIIMHNLELQGIEVPQSLTIAIDRGHYDCTGTNYAVITVRTEQEQPHAQQPHAQQPTQSFYCSFFSQKAVQGMDPAALHQYWLGNCYLHVDKGPACSFRHESGHAKTWKKTAPMQDYQDQEDAVSVEPICPKSKDAKSKDKLRIIQLQKKNLVLRTELDALKSEFKAMKEALGTVKEDQVALAQRHKEQEAITKRANQCLQDWTNKQIIERVWTLETQHAYIRSEHLKQKEQRAHDAHQKAYEAHQKAQEAQPAQEAQKPNVCKSLKKKLKKELKQMSARLVLLENENNNKINNNNNIHFCNKCNNDQITNPFDFKAIYEHYGGGCPALDLIQNYCAEAEAEADPNPEQMPALIAVPSNEPTPTNEPTNEEGESDDDDFFEIHVEVVQMDGPK
jgi:hypothetical protein